MQVYNNRERPIDTQDAYRNGLLRIGIVWQDNDYMLYWEDSDTMPTTEDVVSFATRHQNVVDELIARDMSPEDFAADWSKKMEAFDCDTKAVGKRVDVADGLTVSVLIPSDWTYKCPAQAVATLVFNAGIVGKRDVQVVGWQARDRLVLEVVMRTMKGAVNLIKWIEQQSEDGIWEAYAVNIG